MKWLDLSICVSLAICIVAFTCNSHIWRNINMRLSYIIIQNMNACIVIQLHFNYENMFCLSVYFSYVLGHFLSGCYPFLWQIPIFFTIHHKLIQILRKLLAMTGPYRPYHIGFNKSFTFACHLSFPFGRLLANF